MEDFKLVENKYNENPILKDDMIYINGKYQVNVRLLEKDMNGALWLSIKRYDKDWIHDWRELQEIKNKIAGPERIAVEIYPRESNLVDSSNQYHLWVLNKNDDIPFGFKERFVVEGHDTTHKTGGTRQRAFDLTPEDCLTLEEANKMQEEFMNENKKH